jgi:hypothetical protein
MHELQLFWASRSCVINHPEKHKKHSEIWMPYQVSSYKCTTLLCINETQTLRVQLAATKIRGSISEGGMPVGKTSDPP